MSPRRGRARRGEPPVPPSPAPRRGTPRGRAPTRTRSRTSRPASTSRRARRRSSSSSRTSARRSGPRWSATSAASAGSSSSVACRTATRVLVSSTDGVGTKSVVASLAGRYNTIGIDVVAMSVDDIAATGAEPLFFLDYISVGKLVPEQIDQIVEGVAARLPRRRAARCSAVRCRSTPGCSPRASSTSSGSRSASSSGDDCCPPASCRATASSAWPARDCAATGTRSRGARARARRCLARRARVARGPPLARRRAARPERDLRAGDPLHLRRHVEVHAFCHVTGGGIAGNLERVLPARLRRGRRAGPMGGAEDLLGDPGGRRREPTTRWSTCSTSESACSSSCRRPRRSAPSTLIRRGGNEAWLDRRDRRRGTRPRQRSNGDRSNAYVCTSTRGRGKRSGRGRRISGTPGSA